MEQLGGDLRFGGGAFSLLGFIIPDFTVWFFYTAPDFG